MQNGYWMRQQYPLSALRFSFYSEEVAGTRLAPGQLSCIGFASPGGDLAWYDIHKASLELRHHQHTSRHCCTLTGSQVGVSWRLDEVDEDFDAQPWSRAVQLHMLRGVTPKQVFAMNRQKDSNNMRWKPAAVSEPDFYPLWRREHHRDPPVSWFSRPSQFI